MQYLFLPGVVLFGMLLSTPKMPPELPPPAPVVTVVASSTLDVWIYRLGDCESGNDELAINPVDLDGTPSKGQYQFKDGTFKHFSQKYNIPVTSIWNGDEQEKLLRRMIDDPEVDLHHQFPDCTRKLGLPNKKDL